jgi:mono/diheme cytochrome c family protein
MLSPATADEAEVKRGEYLVNLSGCNDCHTPGYFFGKPDISRYLGGSDVGFEIPGLGVFIGRNITPDKETGIGSWSAEEIRTALQSGVRPDGRTLAPIMPWHAFAQLTEDDARAIVAFLQSVKPVNNPVPRPVQAGGEGVGLHDADHAARRNREGRAEIAESDASAGGRGSGYSGLASLGPGAFRSLLMCDLRNCRQQFLGIRRPERIEALLQNLGETPAHDAATVDQEVTDNLPRAGSHRLLIGFRHLISFLLVEKLVHCHDVHRLGQLAREMDAYCHDRVHPDLGQAESAVRGPLRVGCGEKIGRVVTEIEPRPLDRRSDHRQAFDTFLTQGRPELRHRRDMAAAERAVQASKHTDQQRVAASKIIERDLAFARDCIEHNIRCPVARLQRAVDATRGHGQPPAPDQSGKGSTPSASGLSPSWGRKTSCVRAK